MGSDTESLQWLSSRVNVYQQGRIPYLGIMRQIIEQHSDTIKSKFSRRLRLVALTMALTALAVLI